MTDSVSIGRAYDVGVNPDREFQGGKLRWVNTRAPKEIRYEHFNDKDADIKEKERWSIEIIKTALRRSKKPVVSSSFGVDSMVTLYLTRQALIELERDPSEVDVVWNDTKNEFPEVRKFAKKIEQEWNLNLIVTSPKKPLKKVIEDNGGVDSSYFTARKGSRKQGQPLSEKCCATLKHEPMNRATKENAWDAIINGLRADESNQRLLAALRDGEFFYSSGTWKAYVARPILWWKEEELWEYVEWRDIPYNDLYKNNLIQKYPDDVEEIVLENEYDFTLLGLDTEALINQQVQSVSKRQSIALEKHGFKIFTPRTGCMMCPIPVKYGYMQWMRTYYPKVYDAMVHKLGYGPALLDMVPQETREEIEMLTGVDITAENAHEHLYEILESKPCIFDEFDSK